MNKKSELLSIGEAAKMLDISIETLRRWDKAGKFSSQRTTGGQRRYHKATIEDRLREDLYMQAKIWVSQARANEPNDLFYCATRDMFEARLRRLDLDLLTIKNLGGKSSLISSSAGEIGNNSFDHNLGRWHDVPGIYFGYDILKRKIVLADRGQGIWQTLRRVRPDISSHVEALKVAFTEIVTGRAPEHRGNGLKYVRRNVEAGYFSLRFQTGDAELQLNTGTRYSDKTIQTVSHEIHGCLTMLQF